MPENQNIEYKQSWHDDIDEKSIAKFIEDSKEKGRMPDTKGLSTKQILDKLHLTESDKIKRAAIILFGKDPNRFYPSIQVKIGRFGEDSADLKFHEIVEGNLVYMLREVQVQLNYKFLTRPIEFKGFFRIEKGEYPEEALREMLLNALVHRTYMGAPIQMRVFDNRLTIWNEGTLPFGITQEDLRKEHSSRPRNQNIAEACFKAGYIDTWGRGIQKIVNSCKEAKLPEPEIIEKNGGMQTTLFKVTDKQQDKSQLARKQGKGKPSGYLNNLVRDMIAEGLIKYTIPDKPNSRLQKYRITEKGLNYLKRNTK